MNNFSKNLDSFFGSRDKHLTKINEAVDYLSRSTRENLAILNIDSEKSQISMVSESDNLINCRFNIVGGTVRLDQFSSEKLSEVLSDTYMDSYASNKVSDFVNSLRENKFENADTNFSDLLTAFTNRSQVSEYRAQVGKAKESLDKNIFETDNEKFSQLKELTGNIKNEINNIEEFDMDIINALKLNNAMAKAFNLPKQDLETLQEVIVPQDSKSSLYQMISENELVRKEIINAKGNLAGAWHSNSAISELASCIYENEDLVGEKLLTVVEEIPYFALASKREIQEVLASTYEVINPGTVSTKDIRQYTSKLFEAKKPLKEVIVEMLNINYGININNLKMVPSFKTLAETQSSLFTLLSEHLEKGGLCQKTAKEFGSYLRNKSGVGVLDVSDFVMELFSDISLEDEDLTHFMKPVNLQEAIKDLMKGKDKDKDEDEHKERSNDDEDDPVDAKKLKAVAKKAKDIASKLKGEDPEKDDDGEKDGDDTEADKDVDGDGDVDNVDKKVTGEKKDIKKAMKEKQAKDKKGEKEIEESKWESGIGKYSAERVQDFTPPTKEEVEAERKRRKKAGLNPDGSKRKKKDLKEQAEMEQAEMEQGPAPEEAGMGEEIPSTGDDSPEMPGLSDDEMTDLVSDLETIFQDIDFSKGQEVSQEEQAEEDEAIAMEEKESELAQAQQDLQSAQEKVNSMMVDPEGKVTEASKGYDEDDVKTAKRQVRRDNEGEGWLHSDEDPTFKASLKGELARGTKEGAYKRRTKKKTAKRIPKAD